MADDKLDAATRNEMLAQGEAGLFFVEALALALVDKGIVTADEVVEALEVAKAAKRRAGKEGFAPRLSHRAAGVLSSMMNSFSAMHRARPRSVR